MSHILMAGIVGNYGQGFSVEFLYDYTILKFWINYLNIATYCIY